MVATAILVPTLRADAAGGITERVSIDSAGAQANNSSGAHTNDISDDGRYVAFWSRASNLVAGDTNGYWDVFLRDREAGATERVSISSSGDQANCCTSSGGDISITDDNRYLVFSAWASNLVSGDSNATNDVFLRDLVADTTSRVSLTSAGDQIPGGSWDPAISGDGRYVAFEANDDAISGGGSNGQSDVFVRDLQTGAVVRASISSGGDQADDYAWSARISGDGRYVAFGSWATNLVSGDTNSNCDVFVRDLVAGTTERVSVTSTGAQSTGDCWMGGVSADGRYVAFVSNAPDLVANDTNGEYDVFVRDRVAETTTRVSVSSSGEQAPGLSVTWDADISADGRYVTFASWANNLVPDDTAWRDIFIRDLQTSQTARVSVDSTGQQANASSDSSPVVSADGRFVAFASGATNLVPDDTNAKTDVFVREVSAEDYITRDPAELYGFRDTTAYDGDPVNTATGNFTDAVTDVDFPSQVGLTWSRTYNSRNQTAGVLGKGWSASLGATISEAQEGTVTLVDWDGRHVVFAPSGSGGYVRPEEFFGTLIKNQDATFTINYFDGRTEDFDASGRLATRSNWDGQDVTFTYSGGQLSSLSSSTGYGLSFSYDAEDRIDQVTASDGRAVSYTYGASGGLATVAAADGGQTIYQTNSAGRVTRITDPDGVKLIENSYDDDGRVTEQTAPSGDTITFSYNDTTGVTTVTRAGSGAVTKYHHDHDGRVTKVVDPFGEALTKTYDSLGNLSTVTDRRGAVTSLTYDSHGNVLTRTLPGNVSESFDYDAQDRLTSSTDLTGAETTFTYQGTERLPATVTVPEDGVTTFDVVDGLAASVTDADGVTTEFTYDDARNLLTATDEAGKVTTYTYDAAGNLTSKKTALLLTTSFVYDAMRRVTSVTDPADATASQTYTDAGRVASQTDEAGKTTGFDYDSAGRLESVTDPEGGVTSYGYDADGNLTSVTRPGNATSTATYNKLGRRTSETDPTGVNTTYGYDADGNLTTITDDTGKITTRTYDLRGRLTEIEDPLGRSTTYAYDAASRITSITNGEGGVTAYDYDGAGRLISTTDPLGKVWNRFYTGAGRLAAIEDPRSNTTSYAYNALGRLTSITDPEGGVTEFAYDIDGRRIRVTSPEALVTAYDYDAAGRVNKITDTVQGVTSYTYTPRAEVASMTDPEGGVRSFTYDGLGRLLKAIDPNNGETLYTYDGRGNVLTRTDAKSGVETYTYDKADRLLTREDPLHRTTAQTYDALGRLKTIADPSGRTATLSYDDAGQLTSRAFTGGPTITFAYDDAGRRTQMNDSTGTTSYTWNLARQLTAIDAPNGNTLSYAYDDAGNRASLTYPGGAAATYSYDANNRLTALTHPAAGSSASYTYDADGRLLSETIPGGVSRTYAYTDGRLTTFKETLAGTTTTTTLGYDDAGRIVSETTGGATTTYAYDPAGQLTAMTNDGTTTAFTYDAVGNRTQKQTGNQSVDYTYDAAQQILSATRKIAGVPTDSVAFTHDDAGRLTGATAAARALMFTYDKGGILSKITDANPLSGQNWITDRTTDGDGRLVTAKTTSPLGTERQTNITWDTNLAVPEIVRTASAGSTVDLLNGPHRALAIRGGQIDAFSYDAHGSTLAKGEASDLARAGSYDAFGAPKPTDPTQPLMDELLGPTSDSDKDHAILFGYRGETHLDGLIHLRARDVAPGLGRFTTQDPLEGTLGEATVANPYPYAANDPLNKIDPLGLTPITDDTLRVRADLHSYDEIYALYQQALTAGQSFEVSFIVSQTMYGWLQQWAVGFTIEEFIALEFARIVALAALQSRGNSFWDIVKTGAFFVGIAAGGLAVIASGGALLGTAPVWASAAGTLSAISTSASAVQTVAECAEGGLDRACVVNIASFGVNANSYGLGLFVSQESKAALNLTSFAASVASGIDTSPDTDYWLKVQPPADPSFYNIVDISRAGGATGEQLYLSKVDAGVYYSPDGEHFLRIR